MTVVGGKKRSTSSISFREQGKAELFLAAVTGLLCWWREPGYIFSYTAINYLFYFFRSKATKNSFQLFC